MYSPRMWRWSSRSRLFHRCILVFSTYVEVILIIVIFGYELACILHVCGGDPVTSIWSAPVTLYSPRMWRWSFLLWYGGNWHSVFSTYVEVILSRAKENDDKMCILHVCGGDPRSNVLTLVIIWYSPRMWRWSFHVVVLSNSLSVFSTYVEVILS